MFTVSTSELPITVMVFVDTLVAASVAVKVNSLEPGASHGQFTKPF
jgi:hypothetical protein